MCILNSVRIPAELCKTIFFVENVESSQDVSSCDIDILFMTTIRRAKTFYNKVSRPTKNEQKHISVMMLFKQELLRHFLYCRYWFFLLAIEFNNYLYQGWLPCWFFSIILKNSYQSILKVQILLFSTNLVAYHFWIATSILNWEIINFCIWLHRCILK